MANYSRRTLIRLIEPSKYNEVCLYKALVLSTELLFIDPINPMQFLEPKDNCDPTLKAGTVASYFRFQKKMTS